MYYEPNATAWDTNDAGTDAIPSLHHSTEDQPAGFDGHEPPPF
jgi:hypothetical protein